MEPARIALEPRLSGCKNVLTLGVRANFQDYSGEEIRRILAAPVVYYPGSRYAPILAAMGKRTFPSPHCYLFAQDKVLQTALFSVAGVPHPTTRVYYGKRQQERIPLDFQYPFIAKIPRGSARGKGVFLVQNGRELAAYLEGRHVAYIQQRVLAEMDIRVVVIGCEARLAYWRVAAPGSFRTNLAQGARLFFGDVPEEAVDLAVRAARTAGFDDCGVDIILDQGKPLVLEANMKYGREGFRKAGLNYHAIMETLLANGEI
jgi:ribosomal protein S6--L-glutamate ligase